MAIEVKRLTVAEARAELKALAEVLHDAVDGGDSVSYTLDDGTGGPAVA